MCEAEPTTPLHEVVDLRTVAGLVWFGGQITEATIDAAPRLRM